MARKINITVWRLDQPTVQTYGNGLAFLVESTNAAGKKTDSKLSGLVTVQPTWTQATDRNGALVQRPRLVFTWSPEAMSDEEFRGHRQKVTVRDEDHWQEILKEHPRAVRLGITGAYYCPRPLTINGKVYTHASDSDAVFRPYADGRRFGSDHPEAQVLGMDGRWVFSAGGYDSFSDSAREILKDVAAQIVRHFNDADFADLLVRYAHEESTSIADRIDQWKRADAANGMYMNAAAELRDMLDRVVPPETLAAYAEKVETLRKEAEAAYQDARKG